MFAVLIGITPHKNLEGCKGLTCDEQIQKSHRKEVGHTPKWKYNPGGILTEPTTLKYTQ